jgi:integrase
MPFIGTRFTDDEWRVQTAAKIHDRILWGSIPFADGTRLTDTQHWRLLTSSKTFLSLLAAGRGLRKRGKLKGGSVLNAAFYHLEFVRYMYDRHSVRRLDALTLAHLVAFRNFARRMRVRKHVGNRKTAPTEKHAAPASRELRLMYLRYLIELQNEIPDGPNLDRFEAREILRSSKTLPEQRTERIPDDVFVTLMSEATRWVNEVGPTLVTFWNDLQRHRARTLRAWRSRHRVERAFSFVSFRESRPGPIAVRIAGIDNDLRTQNVKALRTWLSALNGACYTLIAGLTGMRVSEMLDIERKRPLSTRQLPDGRRLLRLHSTLHKTVRADDGEPAYWVAGWDDATNPVKRAVELLQLFNRRSPYLFSSTKILNEDDERLSPSSITHNVRLFSDLAGLAPRWTIATHHFRKTFARFVALSAPGAAGALQRQFKHLSIQMTERYFPNDPELIDDIIEASLEVAEQRYEAMLSADRLGGIKGAEILARNAEFRGSAAAKERREAVQLALLDTSCRLVLHFYGACIYDAPRAKCGGRLENVGLDTCVSCVNLVVEAHNLPMWEEHTKGLENALLLQCQNGVVDIELQRQLDHAKKIVHQLMTENAAL